jgi:hypothetical protein
VPVARTEPRRALGAAVIVVAAAALIVTLVVVLNRLGTSSGDGEFVIQVETLLDAGAGDVPACFNDPIGGTRPICIFHAGDEPDSGWLAYDAQVDGCAFEPLTPDATALVNSCTGEAYPFTGEGVPQYETKVDDGELVVDLTGDEGEDDGDTTTTVRESGEVPTTDSNR